MVQATIDTLFQSESVAIRHFACKCDDCGVSGEEYQDGFSICYISRGSFLFKVFRHDLECYNGRFLVNKPGFTHRVQHFHAQPDSCLILRFPDAALASIKKLYANAFNGFLNDPDQHSMVINASAETEHWMFVLAARLKSQPVDAFLIECLVFELIDSLFTKEMLAVHALLTAKQKAVYLPKIEVVKIYLQQHFMEPIGLQDLGSVANISHFHFNRIFRQVTQASPYQYLLAFRLQHARHLLQSTPDTVSHVAYNSGFNSPEHFSYAFKARYHKSPSQLRS
jgi:AraC family transcriptional regulator